MSKYNEFALPPQKVRAMGGTPYEAPKGLKFDDDPSKLRWSLLPVEAIQEVLAVMEFGARKYSPDNWKFVPNSKERYYNAAMRHLQAWWLGEKNDIETGRNHLASVICCAVFMLWMDLKGKYDAK